MNMKEDDRVSAVALVVEDDRAVVEEIEAEGGATLDSSANGDGTDV
jgi:hypothetical protein